MTRPVWPIQPEEMGLAAPAPVKAGEAAGAALCRRSQQDALAAIILKSSLF
jgi:hypothetical protein